MDPAAAPRWLKPKRVVGIRLEIDVRRVCARDGLNRVLAVRVREQNQVALLDRRLSVRAAAGQPRTRYARAGDVCPDIERHPGGRELRHVAGRADRIHRQRIAEAVIEDRIDRKNGDHVGHLVVDRWPFVLTRDDRRQRRRRRVVEGGRACPRRAGPLNRTGAGAARNGNPAGRNRASGLHQVADEEVHAASQVLARVGQVGGRVVHRDGVLECRHGRADDHQADRRGDEQFDK